MQRMKSTRLLYVFILTFIFIISFPIASFANGSTYTVTTDHLNVRSAPDLNSETIGQLHTGQKVNGFNEQNGWVQTYFDGSEGWVASQYLTTDNHKEEQPEEMSKQIQVKADSVRLRSGPGESYSIISNVSSDETLSVLKEKDNWYYVELNDGTTAWIASWLTSEPLEETSEAIQSPEAKSGSLNGLNIMIDPGHGGVDPGASSQSYQSEKDLTLLTAEVVGNKLAEAGANVIYTRTTDTYISPSERAQMNRSNNVDAFISLHYNAHTRSTSNGMSTHYFGGNSDYRLASAIQQSLTNHTSLKNRGVHHDSFLVLRESNAPAVLLELGFITSPMDMAVIHQNSHPYNVGEAVTEGLINYFN
ncbi:MAG TPA: N-acetylmuramoyl-L-alanine amidase [Bacillota bacterium]|nr:N-acetylmuramoyl-L-alanine amidase [Bacillota bacterium]